MHRSLPRFLSSTGVSFPAVISTVVLVVTVMVATSARTEPGEAPRLTLERLLGEPSLDRDLPREPRWRPGHQSWTWTEADGGLLMEEEAVSGERRILLRATALGLPQPPDLADAVFTPDGRNLLLIAGDDLLLCDLAAHKHTTLATGDGKEELPLFSPDGILLAYVRDHDLLVYDLVRGQETALSDDGSPEVYNGVLDWVYAEELCHRTRRAFAWSADSTAIVWLRLDDGPIPPFHLVDLLETHSRLDIQRYPKPGDPVPVPSLHVVRFDRKRRPGSCRTFAADHHGEVPYLPRFGFMPDGDAIWYQRLDRDQDTLQLVRQPLSLPETSRQVLITEDDPYWTEPVDLLHFLADGSFLWGSRRDGFQHLYRVDSDRLHDLTPGEWEVTELLAVDPRRIFAWYQASRPTPHQQRIFRVAVNSGDTVEITGEAGTHEGSVSADGSWLLVTASAADRPPHRELYAAAGSHRRTVDANPCTELGRYPLGRTRFVKVPADDGATLDATLLEPPGFDPARRYPAVVYTYGGPHAQVASDKWGKSSFLFNRWLAHQGYLVFALDNRGSAGRGREHEGAIHLRLGSSQLPDQLAGVRWLRAQPWVDAERIGIWGWSYGGYLVAFALTHAPGTFAAGAAVAPVTDWRLYDSIYTERYMGTPAANPDGYRLGSVLEGVADLQDPLLVIHGTADDNVHLQHTLQLADRAWRAGRTLDLMLLPGLGHSLKAPGARLQVYRRIAEHFREHLLE